MHASNLSANVEARTPRANRGSTPVTRHAEPSADTARTAPHHDDRATNQTPCLPQADAKNNPSNLLAEIFDRPNQLLAVMIGLLLLLTYWNTIQSLMARWNLDANYSHGYLVPLVSIYLACQSRPRNSSRSDDDSFTPKGGVLIGSFVVTLGFVIHLLTLLIPSVLVESLSLLTLLAGLTLLIGGWGWWHRLWVPVLFLVFMIPWPSALYTRVAFPLQLLVSNTAVEAFHTMGLPVQQNGNVITLPRHTMHVAEACSGLRQLTAFLAISTCAALIMARPTWYRVVVLLSSVPIAVVINVLRVIGTGLMLHYGDPRWTEGLLHTLEGLVMVALGMGLLMLEVTVLDWLLENNPDTRTSGMGTGQTTGSGSPTSDPAPDSTPPAIGVSVA